MANKSISIDTSKISSCRGRAVGRSCYYAYMKFISNPENEKLIKRKVEEKEEQRIKNDKCSRNYS